MVYLVSNEINPFRVDERKLKQISIEESLELLKPLHHVGLDSETEGLDCFTKKMLSLQLGCFDFQIVYDIVSFGGVIPKAIKEYLNTSTQTFIIQNAKFDLKFLYKQNIIIQKVYDTMLAEIILTNGLQYDGRDLATLTQKYCRVELDKSIRGEIIKIGLTLDVIYYGAMDVKYLEQIMEKQMKNAKKGKLTNAIALDNEFVKALAYIEFCGIKLDEEKWRVRASENIKVLAEKKQALDDWLRSKPEFNKYFDGMIDLFNEQTTCILNWNSEKQVIPLFESLGINCELKDKGQIKKSIDGKKVLAPQRDKFDILPLYLDYKKVHKDVTTYGLKWFKFINPKTGRIHTTFQQIMDTGRLSCGNKRDGTPNLQNLPKDELTRSCFIAERGNKICAADYSGQEQIVLANFSKEPNLLNFYGKGLTEMHGYVAFLMFPEIRKCTLENITDDVLKEIKKNHSDKRDLAKNAGFAINYGGNGATIAKNCNIPKAQGEYVFNLYFESFPGLRDYFDKNFALTYHTNYITYNNVTGRKYFIKIDNPFRANKADLEQPFAWQMPDYDQKLREYEEAAAEIKRFSQNYPIQGSAADITKLAGVYFFKSILAKGWFNIVKIVNVVHDEYIIEAPEELIDEATKILIDCMERAGNVFCKTLPLKSVPAIGDFWIH